MKMISCKKFMIMEFFFDFVRFKEQTNIYTFVFNLISI